MLMGIGDSQYHIIKGEFSEGESLSLFNDGKKVKMSEGKGIISTQAEKLKGTLEKTGKQYQQRLISTICVSGLEHPMDDFQNNAECTKKYLLERITFDRNGINNLKCYVDLLNDMDDKGRVKSKYIDKKMVQFCRNIREIALTIFNDYIIEYGLYPNVMNGKLYILERLKRDRELSDYCYSLLNDAENGARRIRHVDILMIDALINQGRLDEAANHAVITKKHWGWSDVYLARACIRILIAWRDFDNAYRIINYLNKNKLFSLGSVYRIKQWIYRSRTNVSHFDHKQISMPVKCESARFYQTIMGITDDRDRQLYSAAEIHYDANCYTIALTLLGLIGTDYKNKESVMVNDLFEKCNKKLSKVKVTSQKHLENFTHSPLQPSKIDKKLPGTEVMPVI